ncbi:MAG: hypothetical protein ACYDCO_23615 [Armatimonadota bacterium]
MSSTLLVGAAEIDITPPQGTKMAGALVPRPSKGAADPLFVKAIVLEGNGVRMAYAVFDLVGLTLHIGEKMTAAASVATGIPADHIVWSCTHTHSGPVTINHFPSDTPDPVDYTWQASLIDKFAACVAEADRRKAPMRVSRARAYQFGVSHNRRLRYKDGREINTWLLNQGEDLQCVGAAGPIDPEIGMLAFDDENGALQAVLFNFALHNNARGDGWLSAEYTAVVAARLREAFGPQVVTLFLPGACGDLNNLVNYRQTGDALADAMLPYLHQRAPMADVTLGITSRRLTVPLRDVFMDQEERLVKAQWWKDVEDFFRKTQADLQRNPRTQAETLVHAWHIGEVSFATFPGEAFVELGLQLKRESPFPWTCPVELAGDCLGYLVTPQAWAAGGYESLVSTAAIAAPEASGMIVNEDLRLLNSLWAGRNPR